MFEIFLKLLMGHALADFALQNSDMARLKNRHAKPTNVPPGQKIVPCWFYFLTSHALIHGGIVWLLLGHWYLAAAETVAHWLIDFAKCENWINPHVDQFLHIFCKVLWVVIYLQLSL